MAKFPAAGFGGGPVKGAPIQPSKNKPDTRNFVPPSAVCFFREGDSWGCVAEDFVDLHNSPAGFGDTMLAALVDVRKSVKKERPAHPATKTFNEAIRVMRRAS